MKYAQSKVRALKILKSTIDSQVGFALYSGANLSHVIAIASSATASSYRRNVPITEIAVEWNESSSGKAARGRRPDET